MVEIILKIDALIQELVQVRRQAFVMIEFFYEFSRKPLCEDNYDVLAPQVKYPGHVNIIVIDAVLCVHLLLKITHFGVRAVEALVHCAVACSDKALDGTLRIDTPEKQAVSDNLPSDDFIPALLWGLLKISVDKVQVNIVR